MNSMGGTMCRKLARTICLSVVLSLLPVGISFCQTTAASKVTVGILPFDDLSGGGLNDSSTAIIAKQFRIELLKSGRLIPKILTLPAGSALPLEPSKIAELAKEAGVQFILAGSLMEAQTKKSESGLASGRSVMGVQVGGRSQEVSVSVKIRMEMDRGIDGETASAFSGESRKSRANVSVNASVTPDLSTNMQTPDFPSSPLGQAFQEALQKVAAQVDAQSRALTPQAPSRAVASSAPSASEVPGTSNIGVTSVTDPGPGSGASPAFEATPARADTLLPIENEKIDFVPGEKQIFFDDFTDTPKGSPPVHWRVRGASVTMRTKGDAKQLMVTQPDSTLLANLKGLPTNFTMETELDFNGKQQNAQVRLFLVALPSERQEGRVLLWVRGEGQGEGGVQLQVEGVDVGSAQFKLNLNKPVLLNLWMQDGRMRAYVNNERVVDVNQIELPKVDGAYLDFQLQDVPIALGKFRVAASAPDFSKTILSSGRYVTHGIHFDVDSDRLRPDSVPVLKMIAEGLTAAPALKLRIEGHTDSSGDAHHNLDLSQRRAESVKRALVAQFQIASDRLTTAGLGATKPIDSNDKPDGRANNRRVELVKQ
jgi:OOP family OmpA-OmpF porin